MSAARSEPRIVIAGAGAQTPLGRSLLASSAAVRCGISAYAEHPFMIDRHGEPMVVARAEWLGDGRPRTERIAELARAAAEEALSGLARMGARPPRRIEWTLVLPDPDPSCDRAAVARRVGELPHLSVEPTIEDGGHAAGLRALRKAAARLRAATPGRPEACLIVAADSWIDPLLLEALDASGQLHSIHLAWGFTPGEGAAACLLTTAGDQGEAGSRGAELIGVGVADEPCCMGTHAVCIGKGLTSAVDEALGGAGPSRIDHSYCDLNGQPYRADEFAFMASRRSSAFVDVGAFTAPADCWGDLGAATSLALLTLPLAAWERGYAAGPTALIWASGASQPLRAAATVRAPAAEGG